MWGGPGLPAHIIAVYCSTAIIQHYCVPGALNKILSAPSGRHVDGHLHPQLIVWIAPIAA